MVIGAQEVEFTLCRDPNDVVNGYRCNTKIDGDVNLRVVACSASIACQDEFMYDPADLQRGPTLVAGIACGFEEGTPPQDALLSYHPEVRCFGTGDPSDPNNWYRADAKVMVPGAGEHLFFSDAISAQGDVHTNEALLLRPLVDASGNGAGFCEMRAWATITFADQTNGQRRVEHVSRAPAVEWRAIMTWKDGVGWDCHTDNGALTYVRAGVVAGITHDRPFPMEQTALPAAHSVVFVREAPLVGIKGIDPKAPQHGAVIAFSNDSRFPEAPDAEPEPLTERLLWVERPGAEPTPADARVLGTCAEEVDGQVTAIGVMVGTYDTYFPFGAVVIKPLVEGDPPREWDCERVPESGACVLIDERTWPGVVPCLASAF